MHSVHMQSDTSVVTLHDERKCGLEHTHYHDASRYCHVQEKCIKVGVRRNRCLTQQTTDLLLVMLWLLHVIDVSTNA